MVIATPTHPEAAPAEPARLIASGGGELREASTTGRRIVQLDILRGVAILVVLMHHSPLAFDAAGVLRPIALKLVWFGWSGVDLFFVLSGFLIGGLLFEEIQRTGTVKVRRFLLRRGFKIWPSYFCLLAASAAMYAYAAHSPRETFWAYFPNMVHLQNYLGMPDGAGHTWSLAVEEHFYVVLPLVLLLLAKTRWGLKPRWFTGLAVGFLLSVLTVRAVSTHQGGLWFPQLGQTHLRLDALLCGVLLAFIRQRNGALFARVGRHSIPLLLLAAVFMMPAWYEGRNQYSLKTIGLTMTYLSYACLLVAFVNADPKGSMLGKVLASPPARMLAWIGTLSYGMYLWHFQIGNVVTSHVLAFVPLSQGARYWVIGTIIHVSSAILLGLLSTILIERPMLALREKIAPSHHRSRPSTLPPENVSIHLVSQ
jgi:peptidoglycan/LPS O-acetylase OafA/YrhL